MREAGLKIVSGAELQPAKRILGVFSGGGLPGLDIHAGLLMALATAGVMFTHVCGTSAGAIMAALYANRVMSANGIVALVQNLTDEAVRDDVFAWKLRSVWPFSKFIGTDCFIRNGKIVDFLGRLLPEKFHQLQIPLKVSTTRVRDGAKVAFGHGATDCCEDLRSAVLASMSISGVFPYVQIGDHLYADGGVRANLPLPNDWQEYDEVWLLIASPATRFEPAGSRVVGRLMQNLAWLMEDQIQDVIEQVAGSPKIRVLRPPIGRKSSSLHFDHDLIRESYRYAIDAIREQQVAA